MRAERRRRLPLVVHPVYVGDRNLGQRFLAQSFEAAEVDPVHLADRRLVADAEGSHAAVAAKEMLVPAGIEQVLRQFLSAAEEAKLFGSRDRSPKAGPAADRTVAAISRLGQVEVGLEPDRAAVAAASVG